MATDTPCDVCGAPGAREVLVQINTTNHSDQPVGTSLAKTVCDAHRPGVYALLLAQCEPSIEAAIAA